MSVRNRFAENAVAAGLSRRGFLHAFGVSAAVLGSGALLSACGDGGAGGAAAVPTSPGAAPQMTKATITIANIDTYLMDMVAFDQKILPAFNLDVGEYLGPSTGVQSVQMLAANQVNMTGQDTSISLSSFGGTAEGSRPQIVGMRMHRNPYSIIVNKNAQWPGDSASFEEKMHALRGKTIGLTAIGAGADQALKQALVAAGMKYTDVSPLAVGQTTAAIAQMQANKIDAYVGIAWSASRFIVERTGGRIMLEFGNDGAPDDLRLQPIGALVTNQAFLASNKDAVQAWIAALGESSSWIQANRPAAAKILNGHALGGKSEGIAEQFVEHFVNNSVPLFKPNLKVERDGIDRLIRLGTANGTIKPDSVTFETVVPEWARA